MSNSHSRFSCTAGLSALVRQLTDQPLVREGQASKNRLHQSPPVNFQTLRVLVVFSVIFFKLWVLCREHLKTQRGPLKIQQRKQSSRFQFPPTCNFFLLPCERNFCHSVEQLKHRMQLHAASFREWNWNSTLESGGNRFMESKTLTKSLMCLIWTDYQVRH